jgi:hypothetical protein
LKRDFRRQEIKNLFKEFDKTNNRYLRHTKKIFMNNYGGIDDDITRKKIKKSTQNKPSRFID